VDSDTCHEGLHRSLWRQWELPQCVWEGLTAEGTVSPGRGAGGAAAWAKDAACTMPLRGVELSQQTV
jgi:hypothetical protein